MVFKKYNAISPHFSEKLGRSADSTSYNTLDTSSPKAFVDWKEVHTLLSDDSMQRFILKIFPVVSGLSGTVCKVALSPSTGNTLSFPCFSLV